MAGHDSAGLLGWKFAPINAVDHPQLGLDLLALGVERTEEFLVVGDVNLNRHSLYAR